MCTDVAYLGCANDLPHGPHERPVYPHELLSVNLPTVKKKGGRGHINVQKQAENHGPQCGRRGMASAHSIPLHAKIRHASPQVLLPDCTTGKRSCEMAWETAKISIVTRYCSPSLLASNIYRTIPEPLLLCHRLNYEHFLS